MEGFFLFCWGKKPAPLARRKAQGARNKARPTGSSGRAQERHKDQEPKANKEPNTKDIYRTEKR